MKFKQDLDSNISKVIDMGFLAEVKKLETDETLYRIHRIIKEKVTLDDLAEFKQKLKEYDTTDESI